MLGLESRGHGPPVVLVHGFTQTGRSWIPIADRLAESHEVHTLDAPGHGASAAVVADLPGGADLMAAAVPGPAAWVGYSMGGRFALHVALRQPRTVTRLVLVSTTAGIDDADDRADRKRSDEALADRVESEGVEPFVRWWVAQPIFASLAGVAAGIEHRLHHTASGLATSLRRAGTGTQEPQWTRLASLDMPVLIVAGRLDTKYSDLARRLADGIGSNATLAVIDGAGHACHLEQPERFLEIVMPFLGDR